MKTEITDKTNDSVAVKSTTKERSTDKTKKVVKIRNYITTVVEHTYDRFSYRSRPLF